MPNFIRRLAGEKFWEDTGRQLLNHEICQGLSFSKSATFWVLLTLQKSHAIGHWHIVRKRTFTTRDERKPWRSKASNWRKEVPMISQKIPVVVEPSTWDFKQNMMKSFQKMKKTNLASQKSVHVSTSRVSNISLLLAVFLASRTSWRLCRLPERVREPAGQIWHCMILTTWNPRNTCLRAAFQWL